MKMTEKKLLGKSNLEASRLCFGTLALSFCHANLSNEQAALLLEKGYKLGINFWDTAELYDNYDQLKLALSNLEYPHDIIISSRSYAKTYEDMNKSISNCLERLNKKQIEIFGLHEVQQDEFINNTFRPDAMQALIEAKQSGLIRAISLTTHSAAVAKLASQINEIDIIMPLINHKGVGIKDGSLQDMEQAIEMAKLNHKGIYAMKVLAGGFLASDIKIALDYVLKNINIDSIAIGMDNENELIFNVDQFSATKNHNELQKQSNLKSRYIHVEPWCVGCKSCIKACPQNAIILEFGQAKILHDKCIRCGYCISACKDFFIKFLNKREL